MRSDSDGSIRAVYGTKAEAIAHVEMLRGHIAAHVDSEEVYRPAKR